jgi:hypothetical protein
MKKLFVYASIIIIVIFVGIQFVPVNLTNPPVTKEISAPESIMKILKENCYDCHSNMTKWPWYNKIAPISWLIKKDVTNGRANMNFTEWENYETIEQDMKEMILEAVKENRMPPLTYRLGHPSSRLTADEIKIVEKWAKGELK